METMFSEPTLVVWSLLGTALGTLALVAATLWAGAQLTRQARELWRAVRGQTPRVIAAVDEPTDPLIAELARHSHVPAAVWAAFLPAFLAALAVGLDQVLAGPESPD